MSKRFLIRLVRYDLPPDVEPILALVSARDIESAAYWFDAEAYGVITSDCEIAELPRGNRLFLRHEDGPHFKPLNDYLNGG